MFCENSRGAKERLAGQVQPNRQDVLLLPVARTGLENGLFGIRVEEMDMIDIDLEVNLLTDVYL